MLTYNKTLLDSCMHVTKVCV